MVGKPFEKGKSGNPAGRPKSIATVTELARAHTTDALAALAKIAKSGKSESARVAAAVAILDRGYGKPIAPVAHVSRGITDLTDDELAAIAAGGRPRTDSAADDPEVLH